jgi:hypothetical protein
MLHPIARIGDELPHCESDLRWFDPDVPLGCPIGSRPPPHLAEHSTVKAFDEAFVQKITPPPTEYPHGRSEDAGLLELVQFAAQRDMSRNETITLLGGEWSRAVVGFF